MNYIFDDIESGIADSVADLIDDINHSIGLMPDQDIPQDEALAFKAKILGVKSKLRDIYLELNGAVMGNME